MSDIPEVCTVCGCILEFGTGESEELLGKPVLYCPACEVDVCVVSSPSEEIEIDGVTYAIPKEVYDYIEGLRNE